MKHSPLHEEHVTLGARLVEFHGWLLPLRYSSILDEHRHTRTRASVFDCSHMVEHVVRGRAGREALDRLLCVDALGLPVGRCRYGALVTPEGRMVDDAIAMRLDDDTLYLVSNAGAHAPVRALLASSGTGAEDVSAATAKLDVQGPASRDVLGQLGFAGAAAMRYFAVQRVTWRGVDVILARSGYTGELGFELYLPAERAVDLWRELCAAEGVAPAGLGARDTLRAEMGYALGGQDFDNTCTPLEAGLESFIAWESPCVGIEALRAQKARGGYAVLTGIRSPDRRAPRPGFGVRLGDRVIGQVTTGTFGPSVVYGVGLARLPAGLAQGTTLAAGPHGLPVETVEVPFYRKGTCRIR